MEYDKRENPEPNAGQPDWGSAEIERHARFISLLDAVVDVSLPAKDRSRAAQTLFDALDDPALQFRITKLYEDRIMRAPLGASLGEENLPDLKAELADRQELLFLNPRTREGALENRAILERRLRRSVMCDAMGDVISKLMAENARALKEMSPETLKRSSEEMDQQIADCLSSLREITAQFKKMTRELKTISGRAEISAVQAVESWSSRRQHLKGETPLARIEEEILDLAVSVDERAEQQRGVLSVPFGDTEKARCVLIRNLEAAEFELRMLSGATFSGERSNLRELLKKLRGE